MTETKHRSPHDQNAVDASDATPSRPGRAPASADPEPTHAMLEGQLGPDEISEPEEVARNIEAKQHH